MEEVDTIHVEDSEEMPENDMASVVIDEEDHNRYHYIGSHKEHERAKRAGAPSLVVFNHYFHHDG